MSNINDALTWGVTHDLHSTPLAKPKDCIVQFTKRMGWWMSKINDARTWGVTNSLLHSTLLAKPPDCIVLFIKRMG